MEFVGIRLIHMNTTACDRCGHRMPAIAWQKRSESLQLAGEPEIDLGDQSLEKWLNRESSVGHIMDLKKVCDTIQITCSFWNI